MSEELRPCPFCGGEPVVEGNLVACNNLNCPTHDNYWTDPMIFTCDQWNTRPIEDALHARIAELEAEVTKCHELQDSYCDRIAELESLVEQLIWVGNDLLVSNTNPVTITLFNGLVCSAKEREG